MEVTLTKEEQQAVMFIKGRVDTITSPQLKDEILKAFKGENSLVLDFADVQYVSSAGLRALLIGQKTASSKGGKMELRNVNNTVMMVLKSVGFNKILTII
ncbi:MAG: STAS domain-containing protein [Oscillospiraceae bacterium]|nr:STAS domain-containing protein [Oscillospiraceae bacterium]